jgi:hypothetical protein
MMINMPLTAKVWKTFPINIDMPILSDAIIERLLMTSAQVPKFKIGLRKSAMISVLRMPNEIDFLRITPKTNKTTNKTVKNKIVNRPTWINFDQPFRQPSMIDMSSLYSSFCETEYTKPTVNIIDNTVDKNQIPTEIDLIDGTATTTGDADEVI